MRHRLSILALLAATLPVAAWAFDATSPLEMISTTVPAAAVAIPQPCHPAGDELTGTGPCALCATCHLPPPAATSSAPRPAATPAPVAPRTEPERRSTRRQAERLDRPPFIRPM